MDTVHSDSVARWLRVILANSASNSERRPRGKSPRACVASKVTPTRRSWVDRTPRSSGSTGWLPSHSSFLSASVGSLGCGHRGVHLGSVGADNELVRIAGAVMPDANVIVHDDFGHSPACA